MIQYAHRADRCVTPTNPPWTNVEGVIIIVKILIGRPGPAPGHL